MEDALIVAAAAEAEAADLQAEADADMAELEAYCSEHGGCGGDAERRIAGPSCDSTPCSSEFWNFTAGALATNGATIALVSMALAPATPALLLAAGVLAVGSGLAWMYSAGTSLKNCKQLEIQSGRLQSHYEPGRRTIREAQRIVFQLRAGD